MNHPATALSRRYSLVRPLAVSRHADTLGHDDLHLRVAGSPAEFDLAHRLAHEAYVDAGYCDPTPDGRLHHYEDFDDRPETRVFLIRQGQDWVGTVSLTREGEGGLPIDDGFLPDIQALQAQGRRVGVVWRLATLPGYRHSMQAVNALLKACVEWGLDSSLDTTLMMVHARHLKFYRRCFSMTLVREVAGVSKFSRIPVVLVRCDRENLPARWLSRSAGH